MIWTNNFNLPEHVIKILGESYQPKLERIGVSALCDSPRIRTLQITKWDEIERDIACSLTTLGGIALHQRAESFAEQDEQAEQKLEDFVDSQGNLLEITVVGKADVYNRETKQIRDWKMMGVYGLKWQDKIRKFTEQLNCYAWQRRKRHQLVESLWLDVYWSDWSISKYEKATDKIYKKDCTFDLLKSGFVIDGYPPIKYSEVKLHLWTFEQQEQFIKERIKYHLTKPMDCDMIDGRWQNRDTYAVMKEGRKNALRSTGLDTYEKAYQYCWNNDLADVSICCDESLKKGISIVKREGRCIRCGSQGYYCPVWSICENSIKDTN